MIDYDYVECSSSALQVSPGPTSETSRFLNELWEPMVVHYATCTPMQLIDACLQ